MPVLAICNTVTWTIVTSILLYTVSSLGLIFYIMLCSFVTLVCPLWMVKLQSLKKSASYFNNCTTLYTLLFYIAIYMAHGMKQF